jgi:hypothetical protein
MYIVNRWHDRQFSLVAGIETRAERRLRARIDAGVGAHHRAQISRFGTAPAPFLRDAVQNR